MTLLQVLSESSTETYWKRLRAGQRTSLHDVEKMVTEGGAQEVPRVTKVPLFDTELRTVYALRVLADVLTKG